jgi:hypothetical protein
MVCIRSARFRARSDQVVAALGKNSIGVAGIYLELRRSPAGRTRRVPVFRAARLFAGLIN